MDKIIIVTDLGYYHPSNTNWSYHIHLIIDNKGARLYRETFGGDSRLIERLKAEGLEVEELYAGKGSQVAYKYGDIKQMLDIEDYKAHSNY